MMKKKGLLIGTVAKCLGLGTALIAGDMQIQLHPKAVMLGDEIKLQIKIPLASGERQVQGISKDSLAPFYCKVLTQKQVKNEWVYTVTLQTFSLKDTWIPTQNIRLIQNKTERTLILPAQKISIKSALTDQKEVAAGLQHVEPGILPKINWTPYAITLALLLIVLAIGAFMVKKWKEKKKALKEKEKVKTPLENALEAVSKLSTKRLPTREENKALYTALSDALKQYLSDECLYPLMESTTHEILRYLRGKLPTALFYTLREYLELSDGVKFAKKMPSESLHESKILALPDFLRQLDGALSKGGEA